MSEHIATLQNTPSIGSSMYVQAHREKNAVMVIIDTHPAMQFTFKSFKMSPNPDKIKI